MDYLFSLILFFAVCTLIIWIITTISDVNNEIKRQPEVLRRAEEEAAKRSNQELVFNQFGTYVLKLFGSNNTISKSELLNRIKSDYPFYKDDYMELFYDLKLAKLIKTVSTTNDQIELGESFQDVKLAQPDLLEFMRNQCIDSEFKSNLIGTQEIFQVEINSTKKICDPNIYFAFGACSGKELSKKIKVPSGPINLKAIYIYGKSYKNEYSKDPLDNILLQYYCELTTSTNYTENFSKWRLATIPF